MTSAATDDLKRFGFAGGVVLGEKVGVGVSVGVHIVDRTTLAYIGRADADEATTPDHAAGKHHHRRARRGTVGATTTGTVVTVSVAGAWRRPRRPRTPTCPCRTPTLSRRGRHSIAVNLVTSRTKAYLDQQNLSADSPFRKSATSNVTTFGVVIGGRSR